MSTDKTFPSDKIEKIQFFVGEERLSVKLVRKSVNSILFGSFKGFQSDR